MSETEHGVMLEGTGYLPTRLVTGRRGPAAEWNIFGELVEPEDVSRRSSPGRTIPITEAMRQADAARQRKEAEPPAWSIKREMRAENLANARPATPRPGRMAEKPERVRLASPEPQPKLQPVLKKCQWCGEQIAGYTAHRKHQAACARLLRLLRPKNPQTQPPQPCAAGCGKHLRNGRLQRPDLLCRKCGAKADRKAARQRDWKRCAICDKPLRTGTANECCRRHQPPALYLRSVTREEYELNQAWAALTVEDKAAVMEQLAGDDA